jgi:hypothetical protein
MPQLLADAPADEEALRIVVTGAKVKVEAVCLV